MLDDVRIQILVASGTRGKPSAFHCKEQHYYAIIGDLLKLQHRPYAVLAEGLRSANTNLSHKRIGYWCQIWNLGDHLHYHCGPLDFPHLLHPYSHLA